MKKLYSGNLSIEYGQFYIEKAFSDEDDSDEDDIAPDSAFKGQENGLWEHPRQVSYFSSLEFRTE